jgi:hypothetical protein
MEKGWGELPEASSVEKQIMVGLGMVQGHALAI